VSGNPWPDTTPQNMVVVPRGSIRFIPVRIEVQGVLTPPDADAFTYTTVRQILDPDGNDVTDEFVTNELDTAATNPTDVWDEDHADYVGDEASPENVGLFARHVSGDLTGQVAQKVKAPLDAEITLGSSTRRYKIIWGLRLFDQVLQDGDGELFEYFHVAPPGSLVFGDGYVSIEEVTDSLSTTMDPEQIERLISRASKAIAGMVLDICKVDVSTFTELPYTLREAIILYTQGLILEQDGSSGGIPIMRKEGRKEERFSVSTEKMTASKFSRAEAAVMRWCGSNKNRPKFRSFRQGPTDGVWDANPGRDPDVGGNQIG